MVGTLTRCVNEDQEIIVNDQAGTVDVSAELTVKHITPTEKLKDMPLRDALSLTMEEFLSVPIPFRASLSTEVRGDSLVLNTNRYIDFPKDFVANTRVGNKLDGYKYLSPGELHIRIETNPGPGQTYLLYCNFLPSATEDGVPNKWFNRHNHAQLQLPGTYVSNHKPNAEVIIPYRSPYSAYDLIGSTEEGCVGRFRVNVCSPLAVGTGGSSDVSVTVWAWFEGAMPHANVAESHVEDEAAALAPMGTVSSAFEKLSDALNVAGGLPSVGPMASTGALGAKAAANAARAFGYSKPQNESLVGRVTATKFANMQNSDGTDDSVSMSIMTAPSTGITPGISGEVEETSFDYVLSRHVPAKLANINTGAGAADNLAVWQASDAAGVTVFTLDVIPSMQQQLSTPVRTGPLSYVSQLFEYWRGGFVVRLHIVASELHGGRLVLTFNPNTVAVDGGSNSYASRTVIDIEKSTTVDICVPYISNSSWMATTDSIGTISCNVLNKLKKPSVAPDKVFIFATVAAQPGFKFAAPQLPSSHVSSYRPAAVEADYIAESLSSVLPDSFGRVNISSVDQTITLVSSVPIVGGGVADRYVSPGIVKIRLHNNVNNITERRTVFRVYGSNGCLLGGAEHYCYGTVWTDYPYRNFYTVEIKVKGHTLKEGQAIVMQTASTSLSASFTTEYEWCYFPDPQPPKLRADETGYTAESGETEVEQELCVNLGNGNPSNTHDAEEDCIGEVVKGLRPLLMRYTPLFTATGAGVQTADYSTEKDSIMPWSSELKAATSNRYSGTGTLTLDAWSFISCLYMYSRGSARLMCSSAAATDPSIGQLSFQLANRSGLLSGSASTAPMMTENVQAWPQWKAHVGYQVPQYMPLPFRINTPFVYDGTSALLGKANKKHYPKVAADITNTASAAAVSKRYYRSMGSDIQLFGFVGCPDLA